MRAVFVMMGLALSVAAQQLAAPTATSSSKAAEGKEVENQIVSLEKRTWNGEASDVSKLEADDYEAIKHAHRYTRADDESASKDMKVQSWSIDDTRVRVFAPDVALLTYRATQTGTFRGIKLNPSAYFGSLWVNRGGEWKNVFLAEAGPDAFTDAYKPAPVQQSTTTTAQKVAASSVTADPKSSQVPSGKAVLDAYVSAWKRHDFAALEKLLTPDAIHEDVAQGVHAQGLAEIKKFMREEIEGEPDLDWRLTTVVQAGPVVAAEWTWTGTYTGEGPTGHAKAQRISGRGASVVLIENGRIKHFTDYYDFASFFPKPTTADTAPARNDLPAAKPQVLDLEQEWVAAEHNHDAAALRRVLDDKFVASFGAGKPYDKEAFIKGIISGDVDPTESQTLADRTVIIDHDTAVVVGTDTERGTKNGVAYTVVARYTVTYIHRNGQWLALAEHLAEMPQGK